MGAGVIPFTVRDRAVSFLFQRTFAGRKTGYLIDFGGGLGSGEDYRDTAIREFIEETETLYFSDDPGLACRTDERVRMQIPVVRKLFEETLSCHPGWCCRRAPGDPFKPKHWKTFFIEFPFRDIEAMNREWEADRVGRFRKRRQLVWISADELLSIYTTSPDRLWKRVRQLEGAEAIIRAIQASKLP